MSAPSSTPCGCGLISAASFGNSFVALGAAQTWTNHSTHPLSRVNVAIGIAYKESIDAARKDIVETRQKLRAVQLELNRDISRLETTLRLFDIVAVPALLTILAVVMGLFQRRRRARARA